MPQYSWRCEHCNEYHEVARAVKDIDVGPEACTKCAGKEFKRTIEGWTRFQSQLVHGGKAPWFAETIVPSTGKPNGR